MSEIGSASIYGGTRKNGYVVGRWDNYGDYTPTLLYHLSPSGKATFLRKLRASAYDAVSPDGRRLAVYSHKRVTVIRLSDGRRLHRRTFKRVAGLTSFEFLGNKRLLMSNAHRTVIWRVGTSRMRTFKGETVDVRGHTILTHGDTKKTRNCDVTAPLAKPQHRLWRTCSSYIDRLSPNGKRLISERSPGTTTTYAMRGRRGRPLGRYRVAADQTVYPYGWESKTAYVFTMLLGEDQEDYQFIRCTHAKCVRASDIIHDWTAS